MRLGAVRLGGEFILCVHDAPSEARDANPVQSAPTRATRARCGKWDPRAPLNEVASILIRARDVRRGARAREEKRRVSHDQALRQLNPRQNPIRLDVEFEARKFCLKAGVGAFAVFGL